MTLPRRIFLLTLLSALPATATTQTTGDARPFGTLREQAETQQQWLASRIATVVPALMRKYDVDMWVIPMREYNEDPVFTSLVSPTTFAARRRTIYVFSMRGDSLEKLALGGSSQGGVYTAIRSTQAAAGPAGARGERTAELWGDEQWLALKQVIEERDPRSIAVNVSRVFAFSDGLSAGEMAGMRESLGDELTRRFVSHDGLALDLIATRLPGEATFYKEMQEVAWSIIDSAFSNAVITPGVTTTQDVVWWMRQRVNDLGLGSWFQPSVSVQRRGVTEADLGPNPMIQRGDVLHCDFGIVALGLNTDTQHMGYVLHEGEPAPPAGLVAALRRGNRLQDIVMEEIKPGRTGNEVLLSSRARMLAEGIDGTVYTHPIGKHGHGAGPLIGLWDYQEGVPGRGDAKIIPSMWFSIELQATSPVPEWNGQRVRMALEEDMTIDAAGKNAWALRRQTGLHLVR
ncbi:MAG: M24 family metallopeptidase [Gemmatimonadaceae bacterium]